MDDFTHALEELQARHEELEQQQRDIERERSRCDELFDNAPDAYLMTDVSGVIRRANGAAARLLGVEARFLIGKRIAAFVDEHSRRAFRRQLDLLCGTDVSSPWTFEMRRRDQTSATVEVNITRMREGTSRVLGLRWLLRDVTKQKRAERRICQLNSTLEERVADRTKQLADRTRQLEQVIAERDALLRALSHDIRVPLQSIVGYGGLIELTVGDDGAPTVRECLARIGRSTESVLTVLDRLGESPAPPT